MKIIGAGGGIRTHESQRDTGFQWHSWRGEISTQGQRRSPLGYPGLTFAHEMFSRCLLKDDLMSELKLSILCLGDFMHQASYGRILFANFSQKSTFKHEQDLIFEIKPVMNNEAY
jgi:hypothetical protein